MHDLKNMSFEKWLELPKNIWATLTEDEKNSFAKLSFVSIQGDENKTNGLYQAYIKDVDYLVNNSTLETMREIAENIMNSVNDEKENNDFPYNTKNYIISNSFINRKDYSKLERDDWTKITSIEWNKMTKEEKMYFAKIFFTFHETEIYANEIYEALLEDVETIMSLKPEKVVEGKLPYIKMMKVIEIVLDSLYPEEYASDEIIQEKISVTKTKEAFDKYFSTCTSDCSTCGGCH